MAAIVTSPAACSAAAAVDVTSWMGTSGRFWASQLRHWASPCGCAITSLISGRSRAWESRAPQQISPPDRRDRRRGQRTAVGGRQTGDDLSLSVGGIRRQILPSLEVSDLEGGLGSLVEEVEDLVV